MFRVCIMTTDRKSGQSSEKVYLLGEPDSAAYNKVMKELGNDLYDLDLVFDEEQGDGDMMIDDILVMAAEEEPFEETLTGRRCQWHITGEVVS